MRHTFFGGVCPTPHKQLTRRKPIALLEHPLTEVAIPLRTSSQAPAFPVVRPGDPVKVGQPIGMTEGVGAYVHASISGTVTAIEDRPHIWGGRSPAVVIKNDFLDAPWPGRPRPLSEEEVTLDVLLERVKEAGIVGMGGGAFPTFEKLRLAAGRIRTLIINAAECEPFVTADHRVFLEHNAQILQCAEVLLRCLGGRDMAIVIEGDKLNAVELVDRRLRKQHSGVKLYTLRTRYPMGGEKQVVQIVTGREMAVGQTALDAGCLVLNVSTIYAIYQALFLGLALTERAVTITGGAVRRPRNMWVPIGTPLRHLLGETDGLRPGAAKLSVNGVMMGLPVEELDAAVLKDTSCLVCLAQGEYKENAPETVCIRCGKCVTSCPMHLTPALIAQALRQGDEARLVRLHPEDCMGCGCCSFICPANIPLTELVTEARDRVRNGGQKWN